jgi:hypothetical protein
MITLQKEYYIARNKKVEKIAITDETAREFRIETYGDKIVLCYRFYFCFATESEARSVVEKPYDIFKED